LNEIAFLKIATHILSTVFAHIWSTYAETEAYFGKLIFAFLIHTLVRKKMAKIAFLNLNRHHFEKWMAILGSLWEPPFCFIFYKKFILSLVFQILMQLQTISRFFKILLTPI
jgi:predicted membrane metal-binding protein